MKNFTKKFLAIFFSAVLGVGTLAGCSNTTSSSSSSSTSTETTAANQTIKVGVSAGPYNVLFDDAVAPILENEGYTIERVEFQDLLQSAIALNNDEVDLLVAQHTAWIDNFNASQGGRMVPITPIPTVPAGIFSSTNTSLDQIEDGAKIAIPDDASNTARAYALIEKAGWITLKENTDLMTVSADDVIDNPNNIEFVEMSSLNIPRSLSEFDYAVITGSVVYNAKIDASTALLQEDIQPYLILQAAVNEEDVDTEWAKAVVAAYHSEEFKEYMEENNTDNFWYIPTELQ